MRLKSIGASASRTSNLGSLDLEGRVPRVRRDDNLLFGPSGDCPLHAPCRLLSTTTNETGSRSMLILLSFQPTLARTRPGIEREGAGSFFELVILSQPLGHAVDARKIFVEVSLVRSAGGDLAVQRHEHVQGGDGQAHRPRNHVDQAQHSFNLLVAFDRASPRSLKRAGQVYRTGCLRVYRLRRAGLRMTNDEAQIRALIERWPLRCTRATWRRCWPTTPTTS